MKRLQAFKFQLRPGGQQECEMRRFAGACRFVFNRALARQNENHEAGNKYIPYGKMASWLVEWKNATETQWLKDSPSQPLQQSLKDLERAYKNFFRKRAAFPRFKKRGQNDAFRYPQGVKLDQENSRIFLPKLGWMRYRNSRQVTGVVKNVTVSQSCGKWYISIQTESEVSTPVHPSASMVDQGWYEMRRQLEYKQLWSGGQVLAVPPAYTSQRCACCGHTAKENRLSQSQFRCQVCGYTANADVNGARNILAAGHAVLACGEMVQSGRSLKQEPTEMIQATA
ncbi:transposase [Escherichia coli]|uniref:RNA-guided endonuclease InsQ/TnpB family protein n=1 Tax=Escherichia coli TaxID=562 RepID=UPI000E71DBC5|nr:RNA-guided endonuclease TnpB family protein [Escherichia coli]RJT83771.1 transposase [Escherichia coli]